MFVPASSASFYNLIYLESAGHENQIYDPWQVNIPFSIQLLTFQAVHLSLIN